MGATHDVFIIHGTDDRTRAEALRQALLDQGLRPFIRDDLPPGSVWMTEVPAAQQGSAITAVLVSKALWSSDPAYAAHDHFSRELLDTAIDRMGRGDEQHRIIPILLDRLEAEDLPHGLRTIVPLSLPTDDDWPTVAHSIRQLVDATRGVPGARPAAEVRRQARIRFDGRASIPQLPRCFVQRPEEVEPLKAKLLGADYDAVGITSRAASQDHKALGLQGMGGLGKTVLAMALAHDPDVRAAFPDGIYWLDVGRGAPIEERQAALARLLGDASPRSENWIEGRRKLWKITASLRCLIILDDVWEEKTAEAFNQFGQHVKLLVTTRIAGVLGEFEAYPHRVDVLDSEQAHQLLLAQAGQRREDLTARALSASEALADECGGLPLALALIGALIADGTHSFESALREMQASHLEDFEHKLKNYQHRSVFIALDMSVRALDREDRRLTAAFHALSVLEEDSRIPAAALQTLLSPVFARPRKARVAISRLVQRNLLFASSETYSMHDLYHDYLREVVDDIPAAHRQAVEAYRRLAPDGWHTVPNDGYIETALCRHLHEGGLGDELLPLLLDLRWLAMRLERAPENGRVESLLRDFRYRPDDRAFELLEHALRLSVPALGREHGQLASQMLGRLSELEVEGLDGLMAQARRPKPGAWFEPLRASLTSPGGSLMQTLEVGRPLRSVALTGDRLLIGDDRGQVREYDLATGALTRLMGEETEDVDVRAIAPILDEWRVLLGTDGGRLEVWRLLDGERVWIQPDAGAPIRSLAVEDDGDFAWVGRKDGTLERWDLQAGERLESREAHEGAVNGLAILEGGKKIVSVGDDGRIVLWARAQAEPVAELGARGEPALCAVAITRDAVAVGFADHVIEARQLDGRLKYTLTGHGGAVRAMSFMPAQRWLVSGADDHGIKVWDADGREVLARLGHHGNLIHGLVGTPAGDRVISVSTDRKAKIWDPSSGGLSEEQLAHTDWIRTVALGPGGEWGVTASRDGTAKVWEIASGRLLATVGDGGASVESVAVVPDRDEIALGLENGDIELWGWRTPARRLRLRGHGKTIAAIDLLPGGRLISGSYDTTIRVWDLESGQSLRTFEQHDSKVRALCVTPNGRFVLSADASCNLLRWSVEFGEVVCTYGGHQKFVRAIAVDPQMAYVLTGSEDTRVRLFDFETGALIRCFEGHAERVRGAAFVGDGAHIASASSDDTVTLWRLDTGEITVRFFGDSPITGMAVVDPGRIFAAEVEGLMHILILRDRRSPKGTADVEGANRR